MRTTATTNNGGCAPIGQFIAEFNIGWLKIAEYDANDDVAGLRDFMPETKFFAPQNHKTGSDGVLYVLEHGDSSGRDGKIPRIEYTDSDDDANDGDGNDE